MWTLLVLNLAVGSMSSIQGFSTPDNCRNAGTAVHAKRAKQACTRVWVGFA